MNTLVASTVDKYFKIKKRSKDNPKEKSDLDAEYKHLNLKNMGIGAESDSE